MVKENKKFYKIAIDGYSGCGKSTIAQDLAKKLGFVYIDTGAMYRAVTLYCIQNNIDVIIQNDVVAALQDIHLEYQTINEKQQLFMNGKAIEKEIRELAVASKVSYVATISEVRKHLVKWQRELAINNHVVMDGRDIGTVVFPEADIKFFITAELEVRAKRRLKELGSTTTYIDEVMKNLTSRDHIDTNRMDSPLKQAEDAIIIDTTFLSREDQLQAALNIVYDKLLQLKINI